MPPLTGATTWRAPWQARTDVSAVDSARASMTDDIETADDAALVAAFVAGRRDAFDVIVVRHRKAVYQLCYRFAGNHEDAAELTQDVFVKAFKGLDKFKGDSALATWLYRIGVNTALSRAAVKRHPTEPIGEREPADMVGRHPLAALLEQEQAKRVQAAIMRLPPRQRATLILRVYHELPHEEIARMLGSSVGAAKANLFHALANLKRFLKP